MGYEKISYTTKMKKDGKKLKKLVRLIQDSLKNSANTVIHSNYKIPNTSGRKREIDVFIVSKVNDFEIKIAIECTLPPIYSNRSNSFSTSVFLILHPSIEYLSKTSFDFQLNVIA
jgi:hypothetical protein